MSESGTAAMQISLTDVLHAETDTFHLMEECDGQAPRRDRAGKVQNGQQDHRRERRASHHFPAVIGNQKIEACGVEGSVPSSCCLQKSSEH